MKILRLFTLCLTIGSVTLFTGCGDDDDTPVSRINFAASAYDVNGITLDPITVTLTLSPAAAGATTIGIDITGNTDGLTFNPALSGSSLEIPVAAGDESVSFTVSFTRANLPSENLQITMDLGELGPNLNTGITTSANINVPFIDLVTIPYSEAFGDTGATCDEVTIPPAGWTIETPIGVLGGGGDWTCIVGAEGDFVHTGTGLQANAFNTNETIETWIITPVLGPITATTSMDVGLGIRFDPNGGFPYDVDVVVSTDYNGLNFTTANWTRLEAGRNAWLSGDFNDDHLNKYNIDLSAFEGEAISIGFIYDCPDNGNCGIARFDDFEISN